MKKRIVVLTLISIGLLFSGCIVKHPHGKHGHKKKIKVIKPVVVQPRVIVR